MSAPALELAAPAPGAAATFRVVLATQWAWTRLPILAATVACFAVPLFSVQHAGDVRQGFPDSRALLSSMQLFGAWYPLLAGAVGMIAGTIPWSVDHAGRHVYALSLPVPRWYFVLLRLGAGALIALLPVLALWIAARAAAAAVTLPAGLFAYPDAVGLRFALATLVAFAVFFLLASGSTRSAGFGVTALLLLIAADITLSVTTEMDAPLFARVMEALIRWPGVFEIFTGRWMLIDV